MSRVFLFGIDGAAPELVFDEWISDLPNIRKLMESGAYAKMESTIPPATNIAWNSMICGKDASELGFFSYTYRDAEGKTKIVNSKNVKCDLIWDILDKQNKRTVALYVPLSYPVKPINGVMIGGFLTPGFNSDCAYPESLRERIKKFGDDAPFFDVAVGLAGHKGLEMDKLIEKAYEMTKMQLEIVKELIVNEKWDFFMSVMIGSDRLQHMLWRHFDKTHRRYIENSSFKNALKDYYTYLDKEIGEILKLLEGLGENITIIVASDHGMVKQEGKININNWLMEKGYLILKEDFAREIEENKNQGKRTRLRYEGIDLKKSKAYGAGAYNGRIFLNRNLPGMDYEKVREKIIEELKEIKGDNGQELKTEVFKTEEIYENNSMNECPDLVIYFDELRWASNPDFGVDGLYSWSTAIGADSAGHAKKGCFIISGNDIKTLGKMDDIKIEQVAPTILKLLGAQIPDDIKHKPIELNGGRENELL